MECASNVANISQINSIKTYEHCSPVWFVYNILSKHDELISFFEIFAIQRQNFDYLRTLS